MTIGILEDNKVLTTEEVARVFHSTPATVRRWARQKRIPHVKTPGGRYIFDLADIEEYLRRNGVGVDEVLA